MKPQHVGLLVAFLAIGAAGAWWFTLRDNQVTQITQLTGDLQSAQNAATIRQQNEANARQELPVTLDSLSESNSRMQALAARIPTEIDFTPLMLLINNLTDMHLLQHDGITETNREQLTGDMFVITYTLNTTGTFNDQMQFLTDIQSQNRLMVIETVELTSRDGATPSEPLITLKLTLHTYTRGTLPTETAEEQS